MAELRDAFRALRTTPLVTAVAVLSLAIGIGAATALFSLLNAALLFAVACLAAWFPARRAVRLDPARVLRGTS